jgi:single-stranded DNA-binding protein
MPAGWKESLDGKNWELTAWFRVSCWRGLAESVNQYLGKGSQVFVDYGAPADSCQPEV